MKIRIRKILSVIILTTIVCGVFFTFGEIVKQPNTVYGATYGQKQAKTVAKSYLKTMGFSKKGLYKQLRFEGFSKKESNYGVNHCGANWKKQAVRVAKSYLRTMSFSREGLYDQLRYEGFTKNQAKYGVKKAYR